MAQTVDLSDAEWRVMNVVWERQPLLAQDVIQAVAEPCEWTPATVRTMLHRLVKKGALSFTEDGNRYLYRAAVKRADCVRRAARSFLDHVFRGDAAPLLSHYVRTAKFTPEELAELRKLLDQQET
ncbi:MAG TPA: BlaI/MecI/CopY family transcriptional regulator [Pirellulales bacterium]